MTALITTIGVVAAAAITGFVTWRVARRTKSGQIKTTEAETLWDEAKAFWDGRAATLTQEVTGLRGEVGELRAEIVSMRDEVIKTRDHAAECERRVLALTAQVDALQKKNGLT